MYIKITMSYHYTPIRMAKMKMTIKELVSKIYKQLMTLNIIKTTHSKNRQKP